MNTQAPSAPNQPDYLIDERLQASVELAMDLGMPLLVTGEPGTGKTRLAQYVADQYAGGRLLLFNTKTSSKAKDLLYRIDSLRQFRDAQLKQADLNVMNYVRFGPLGEAIARSDHKQMVVLVDEIDKAPRDFPNDVLFEFDEKSFQLEEASAEELKAWHETETKAGNLYVKPDAEGFFRCDSTKGNIPILILTSNSEKNLPDAFLRRCVYHHIDFPQPERLREIVGMKVKNLSQAFRDNMLKHAVDHFWDIRQLGLRKAPATAELIAWIHVLNAKKLNVQPLQDTSTRPNPAALAELKESIFRSYAVLAKNEDDLKRMKDFLGIK